MDVGGVGVGGEGAVEGDAADAFADGVGERDAGNAAYAGDDHGFGQKLEEDVALARAESFFYADLAGALLHADEHDVHQADAGDAQSERSDEEQQDLQAERDDAELRELLHDVGDVNGVLVGGTEAVRGAERLADGLLDGGVVAVVAEPDAVEVLGVLEVGRGGEGDVDDAVEIVVALPASWP